MKRFNIYLEISELGQGCHNMDRAVVTVSVLLGVVGSISIRPEIEEDLSIPPSQDTEIGEYTGGKDGRGRMSGRGNITWPDGSSYHVK